MNEYELGKIENKLKLFDLMNQLYMIRETVYSYGESIKKDLKPKDLMPVKNKYGN